MVSHQKVGLPVCAGQDVGTGDTHLPCAGAGIHHLPAAQIDTYMAGRHTATLEHQHISLLGLAHAVKASVFGAAAPGDGGHVPLLHTCLIQAPVYKAGAVELIGSLGAPDIGAAHLGLCDLYEFIQLGSAGRGRFGCFGGLGRLGTRLGCCRSLAGLCRSLFGGLGRCRTSEPFMPRLRE